MKITPFFPGKLLKSNFVIFLVLILVSYQNQIIKVQVLLPSQQLSIYKEFSYKVYFYPSGIYILNFCKISILIKHLNLEMLGKYSIISNRRPATTHIYAMLTYFSPWQTSTANVTQPFLRKPAHPLRLNIGNLQNLPSCFHTRRFKSITSIHRQHYKSMSTITQTMSAGFFCRSQVTGHRSLFYQYRKYPKHF